MSAYVEIETVYKDLDSLLAALKSIRTRIGRNWTDEDIEVHAEAQHLNDYVGKRRPQTAEVIIRRQNVGGAANDIGFKKNADGTYGAIISDYDRTYYNEAWRQDLNVEYGTAFVEKTAKQKGYRMTKEVQADGSVKMKLSRWR